MRCFILCRRWILSTGGTVDDRGQIYTLFKLTWSALRWAGGKRRWRQDSRRCPSSTHDRFCSLSLYLSLRPGSFGTTLSLSSIPFIYEIIRPVGQRQAGTQRRSSRAESRYRSAYAKANVLYRLCFRAPLSTAASVTCSFTVVRVTSFHIYVEAAIYAATLSLSHYFGS